MSKQYGTYAVIVCNPDDSKEKKLDMIEAAVYSLVEKAKKFPSEPNINTLQFIIKEGLQFHDDPDWYADEKPDYEPSGPFWAITVGIKYREKDEEYGTLNQIINGDTDLPQ